MVFNRQRDIRISTAPLERFADRVSRELKLGDAEFTVCLVSDSAIARWNRAYLGKPAPTDVLSFPAGEPVGSRNGRNGNVRRAARAKPACEPPCTYLGDIAIAPAVARENARRFGRTLSEELRILILHGVLHLLGYDHERDEGQMERLEARLRRRLGLSVRRSSGVRGRMRSRGAKSFRKKNGP
jgi:probable rRNA maturation factor